MEWIHDPHMKIRRKRARAPPMPDDPTKRFEEAELMLTDLVDLYDYDYHDVYDSVFFLRVSQYMDGMTFKDDDAAGLIMRDTGREILETRSTSVKLFIRFFKSIVDYITCSQ